MNKGGRQSKTAAMNESDYHRLADSLLTRFSDMLEDADSDGTLDVELEGAVLTIGLPSGKQYLISKHAASQQIWVSSPASGGLHFSYGDEQWKLTDGRELSALVQSELEALAGVKVAL